MVKVYLRRRKSRRDSSPLGQTSKLCTPLRNLSPSPVRKIVRRENIKRRGVTRFKRLIPDPKASYFHGRHGLKKRGRSENLNAKDEHGMPLLHRAIENFDLLTVQKLLIAGADPNITDKDGSTPFHALLDRAEEKLYMNKFKVIEIAKWLLKARCDFNRVDCLGNTVLHLAFQYGLADIVGFLLDYRVPVNVVNHLGLDPICNGLRYWGFRKKCIRRIGVNYPHFGINNGFYDFSPSTLNQRMRCLNLCIYSGINLRDIGHGDNTPILCALEGVEHCKIIELLLFHKVQVDFKHPIIQNEMKSDIRNNQLNNTALMLLWYAALFQDNKYGEINVLNFQIDNVGQYLKQCYSFLRNQVEFMKKTSAFHNVKVIDLFYDKFAEKLANNTSTRMVVIKLRNKCQIPSYISLLEWKLAQVRLKEEHKKEAVPTMERAVGLTYNSHHMIYNNILRYLSQADITSLRAI